MTDDELDLLASAYLDGEATPEEVAIVEGDPNLMARVERLRHISHRLGVPTGAPDPAIKEAHLAAALAEFAGLATAAAAGSVTDDGAANVIDLSDRAGSADRHRSTGAGQAASSPAASSPAALRPAGSGASRTRPGGRWTPRSMPRWLPAAAALLLLGGGVIWAANRTGGGSSDETAAIGESSDTAAEDGAASDAAASQEAGDAETAEADSMMAAKAPDEENLAQDSAAAGSDATADDSSARSTAPPANGGFFPRDPVASFPQLPDADAILVGLPEPWPDLSPSRCGAELDLPPGFDVIGYLPIEVAGQPVELFVAVDAAGVQSPFVFDEACVQILP